MCTENELLEIIENKRSELHNLLINKNFSLTSKTVVHVSRELDTLLTKYQNLYEHLS